MCLDENKVDGLFAERGFLAPFSFFSPEECSHVLRSLRYEKSVCALLWPKGYAPVSRSFFEMAVYAPLLDQVVAHLGSNVMLWGAMLVVRKPGDRHPWHADIESACHLGPTVSAWIGLENTHEASSLKVVTRSHVFDCTVQQVEYERGGERGALSDEEVLRIARELNVTNEVVQPEVRDGEFFLFDGRLWHGSENTLTKGTRTALLLQYALPDYPLRMPETGGMLILLGLRRNLGRSVYLFRERVCLE